MRRMLLLLTAALVLFAGGVAIGQTEPDTFTGCLTPGGDLKNVAIGDAPTNDCKRNAEQVTWNAEGPQGPAGPPVSVYVLSKVNGVDPYSTNGGGGGRCEPGDVAVSGGFNLGSLYGGASHTDLKIKGSQPDPENTIPEGPTAWQLVVTNTSGLPGHFTGYTVCLDLTP